jgi:taurine dioxygenase
MADIKIRDLQDGLPFGAMVSGATREALQDPDVRKQLNALFEERGVLVFEGMEPSGQMQVALSEVFGSMRDHPTKNTPRADQDTMPGVIDMHYLCSTRRAR